AVGDVLLHRPLQRRGYGAADGFLGIWNAAAPIFRAADIAYANLEGPVAPGMTRAFTRSVDPGPVFDNRVYTSFPLFNYHPRVIADLRAAGINLVSTANNHAMDRGGNGADLTIGALRAAKMRFMGTITAGAPRRFVTLTDTALGQVAWIACTFSNNGIPDPNRQVLHCYDDRAELLGLIARSGARADVAGVIVTPHWGHEYQHSPNPNQRALAAEMVAAGATAIIGTHPHVVQPWEFPPRPDGGRALVVYSTGNFVSGQVAMSRRTGALAWIELCRQPPPRDLARAMQSRLAVSQAGWMALLMQRTAAGPELVLTGPDSTGLAAQAHDLLARHLPDSAIHATVSCKADDNRLIALQ
ncbi:MAG: CapA family protein, partial [Rhodobacter sp.]|nr:CapA family protein [Rhodobacter sp.]